MSLIPIIGNKKCPQVPINAAVTGQVGPGTQVTGNATYQELARKMPSIRLQKPTRVV
jgi:hypothetical protein